VPDGYAAGNLSYLEFTKDGFGIAHFTNGQQAKYCQIPLAVFNNVNGLSEYIPGVYQQTAESGAFNFFFPGQGGGLASSCQKPMRDQRWMEHKFILICLIHNVYLLET
jgi:flagellar hook protein FlgE